MILRLIPFEQAFTGFSNPAVITVACVMIISNAITQTGIIDDFVKRLLPLINKDIFHIAILSIITAILSAFMNNVGALALMMPIAIQTAIKQKRSPSFVLMPIGFASVLGGLITAIGTPPNLLIAQYRATVTGTSFVMFDFTPVGLTIAIVGIVFITLLGWRLLPLRKAPKSAEDLFHMEDYITEIKIRDDSKLIDSTVKQIETLIEGEINVIGRIRKKRKRFKLSGREIIRPNDIYIIQAPHKKIDEFISKSGAVLISDAKISSDIFRTKQSGLIEAVVPQGSRIEGRSWRGMRLRARYGLILIALSRQGRSFRERLQQVNLQAGDVVLLQGETETLRDKAVSLGLLPLVQRGVNVGSSSRALTALLIFFLAIIVTSLSILPIQIAFASVVLLYVLVRIIPVRMMYEPVDWSIIVLLGAMIPIGHALQTTGATTMIANAITDLNGFLPPMAILALLFVITMTLSDIMNNAATAVVMAPIAVTVANLMHMNIDPFLMTVAVSSSCSFLTPISHQNNTLVMGPGGYKFFDYLRMGLPLEIIILVVSIPMIMWVWPLS